MPETTRKRYSRFRAKLSKVLLLIGIFPLIIVSFLSLITVVQTRLENISELQSQVISGAKEKIERYLDQKTSVFNLVIDLNVEDISEISKDRLGFIANGLKEASGNVREITFIDKYGKEIVKISEAQGIKTVFLKDVKNSEDFKTAINGENYFGPVNYTFSGPVMHIASKIENKKRETIGVILAEISLEPIEKEISLIKIGNQGFVYLVDGQGNLIVSSDKDFAQQGENLSYIPLVKEAIDGKIHNGLSREDRYKNPSGQGVIFSDQPIESIDWFIITEWPWEDAFDVLLVMIKQFLLIILGSLILIVAFSLFFSRLVVRPIEILSKGTDEISKGNFDYKIDIKTRDELEKLGESFNKMALVLKENKELRDQFVFIAAHELRAPVTVIKSYLSTVLEGDFGKINKETKEAVETVYNVNEGLVKLVQDLLQIARSEAGKIEIEVKPLIIQQSIKEALEEFKGLARKKKIRLIYQEPDKEIRVMADLDKLKEVITNLIDNAIKYTLHGGIIVVSHEKKEGQLIIQVKDEGIGIAEKDIKQMFSKFYRAKTKETREIPGTGLGLFICKQIIKQMKGEIWVESQVGKGSIFSFTLPLAN